MRNTPARKTQMVTAMQPPTSDVGLIHEPIGSPYPPAGTRPDAIAPTTVPRKNGVTTDEAAKIVLKNLAFSKLAGDLRNAKSAPRKRIPAKASMSGMNSVVIAAAKAVGKAVHHVSSTKISHTLLAAQSGAMLRSASVRISIPRTPPP